MTESPTLNTSVNAEHLSETGYDKIMGFFSQEYRTQMASFLEDFSGQAVEMMHSCHAFGRSIDLSEVAFTTMQLVDQWKVYIGAAVLITILCVVLKRLTVKKESSSPYNLSVFDLAKTAYEPGHKEAVVNLVEKLQYDVNFALPSNGLSLFLCSCLSGNLDLIWYMLNKGANIDSTTRDGDSAMYLATYGILNSAEPDTSVLEMLIRAGCQVNKQNNKGYTPLHRAGSRGNLKIIRCLLQHGADPYLYNDAGIFPIDSAINSDHLEAANLLKIKIANSHVWDVVDPHTPTRISLGLQSPQKKHLVESSRPRHRNSILT